MIQDVDDTLKELLVRKAGIDLADVDIVFDMPSREWSGGLGSRPTINAYLYDVRENHTLRTSEGVSSHVGVNGTIERAPVRMDLSYMISLWTREIAEEHRLLGQILNALLLYPFLPADVLKGTLVSQPFPVRAWLAQPDRQPNSWDFWGHLEHRMKSALSYVVTTAFEPFPIQNVKVVTEPVVRVDLLRPRP